MKHQDSRSRLDGNCFHFFAEAQPRKTSSILVCQITFSSSERHLHLHFAWIRTKYLHIICKDKQQIAPLSPMTWEKSERKISSSETNFPNVLLLSFFLRLPSLSFPLTTSSLMSFDVLTIVVSALLHTHTHTRQNNKRMRSVRLIPSFALLARLFKGLKNVTKMCHTLKLLSAMKIFETSFLFRKMGFLLYIYFIHMSQHSEYLEEEVEVKKETFWQQYSEIFMEL